MTVHGTSFPWKPILAAYAEPYGSSKTVAQLHGLRAGRRSELRAFPGGTQWDEIRTWIIHFQDN